MNQTNSPSQSSQYHAARYRELGRFWLFAIPLLMIWGIFSIIILILKEFELWMLFSIAFLGYGLIFGVTMRIFYEFSYDMFELSRISTKHEFRTFNITQKDGTVKEHKAYIKRDYITNDIYYRFTIDNFNNDLTDIEQ